MILSVVPGEFQNRVREAVYPEFSKIHAMYSTGAYKPWSDGIFLLDDTSVVDLTLGIWWRHTNRAYERFKD